VYRVDVSALGGPLLLVDYDYGEGNTGGFPPTVTDIFLSNWTVASAAQGWNIQGYPNDPVGRVVLRDVSVSGPIAKPNIARYVSHLELKNVLINGVPQ
jgi:hypothetical protein